MPTGVYKRTTNKGWYKKGHTKNVGRKCTWREKISKSNKGKKKVGDFSTWKIGRVGEQANRYLDGRTIYTRIIKRTGRKWKCEKCNSEKIINVHHIDENRKNNKLSNLIILCRVCHIKEHGGSMNKYGINQYTKTA